MENNFNRNISKPEDMNSSMRDNQSIRSQNCCNDELSKQTRPNENANQISFEPRIKFNNALTECLWPHHHNKYSRAEAFVDIIHILQKNTTDFLSQRERGIAAGCKNLKSIDEMTAFSFLETNCSALAKRWHWNRITVSNFLAELERTGVLVSIKERHSVTLYMERNA